MNWPALFWTISALIGVAIVLRVLLTAYDLWRILPDHPADMSIKRLAWLYVRSNILLLWVHSCFALVGIVSLFVHETTSPLTIGATIALLSVPPALIVISVANLRDRDRVAKSPPRGDQ